MSRAIRRYCLSFAEVWGVRRPRLTCCDWGRPQSPGPRPPCRGWLRDRGHGVAITLIYGVVRRSWLASPPAGTDSALPLLVPRVLANHHHTTVPANHLALVADLLDARLNLHRALLSDRRWWSGERLTCAGRRCGRVSGHRRRARRPPGRPEGYGCSAAASC